MADYARGQRLQDLRAKTHHSREHIAAEIGVTAKTLYTWEHGGKIKWPNAQKLGAYYNVDPEGLVSRDPVGEPKQGQEGDELAEIEAALRELAEQVEALRHRPD